MHVIWCLILKWTPMFEWCMCEPKNQPCKHVCWKKIGLCAQSFLTYLDTIINKIERPIWSSLLKSSGTELYAGDLVVLQFACHIFLFNCLWSLHFLYVSDIVHHRWLWPLPIESSRVLKTSTCYELMKRKVKHEKWRNSLNAKNAQDVPLYNWASWLSQIHHKCPYSISHCHSLSKWGEDADFFKIIPLVILWNSKWWHTKVSYTKYNI